ncbi:hypothetical protein AABB24_025499, partial [Solanum stoloniferum]
QNAGNKQNTKYINQYSWYRKRLQVLYKCRKQIQKEIKSLYKCRKQIQKSSSNYISTENRYNSGKNINSRSTLPLPIYVKIVRSTSSATCSIENLLHLGPLICTIAEKFGYFCAIATTACI